MVGINGETNVNETPGEIACKAWTASHKAHHPCNVAVWDDLREVDRADWEAAAEAVMGATYVPGPE